MKPKSVTFAQAIAKKSQLQQAQIQASPKLAQLFQQWTDYPQQEYTIRVDTRARDPMLRVGCSVRVSGRQNMFDSWIQKQSVAENKQNVNKQAGRPLIENRLPKGNDSLCKESLNNVERSNKSNDTKKKYNAQYLYRNFAQNQPEKQLIKYPFIPKSVNSKQVKQSQSSADLHQDSLHDPLNSVRINALIASTENIHDQIANLAKTMAKQHQYKLETQQSEEQQLLIDQSEKKPDKLMKIAEYEQEREKRRWLEAKQVVGSYLKNFNKARPQIVEKYREEPTVKIFAPPATVAYSFASNIEETKKYQIQDEQQLIPKLKQTYMSSSQSRPSNSQIQPSNDLPGKEKQQIQQIMDKIQFKPSSPIEITTSLETVFTKKEQVNQLRSELAAIKEQIVAKKYEETNKGEEIEAIIMRKWQSPADSTKNDLLVQKGEINEFNLPKMSDTSSGKACSPFKTIKQVKNSITNPPFKVSFTKSQDTAPISIQTRPLRFIKTYASPKTSETSSKTTNPYTSNFSNHQLSKIEYISVPHPANPKKALEKTQSKLEKHTYLSTLAKPIPSEPKQPFSTVPLIASKTMQQSPQNSFESSDRFQFDF